MIKFDNDKEVIMQNQWKKITLLAATICWMIAPLNVVHAETSDEEKLDTAIELMRKALEEQEKGNYILGSPFEVCPGKPDVKGFVDNLCEHPSFACRCF